MEDAITFFIKTINQWCLIESKSGNIKYTKGVAHWWYSPEKHYFAPSDPFLTTEGEPATHPYLGAKDWILFGTTVDGEIVSDSSTIKSPWDSNYPL